MASSDPDPALVSEAMEAFVDDDFVSAFELYTKLVDASPTHASSWVHRSATLLKLGKPAEALSDADKATALDPRNSKAHLRRGMALFDLGRHEEARASSRPDAPSTRCRSSSSPGWASATSASPPPDPRVHGPARTGVQAPVVPVAVPRHDRGDGEERGPRRRQFRFELRSRRRLRSRRDGAGDYRLDVRLFGVSFPTRASARCSGANWRFACARARRYGGGICSRRRARRRRRRSRSTSATPGCRDRRIRAPRRRR